MGAVIKWLIIAFFNNYTNAFFVIEREIIVANLRKTKLLSLWVLAIILICIRHTLVALYYEKHQV